jgi:hypothetical protein
VNRIVEDGMRTAVIVFACTVVTLVLGGCNQRAIESWLSEGQAGATSGPSLYTDEPLGTAITDVKKKFPGPIQALSLLIYRDHMVLQAQDPVVNDRVLQFVYRAGAVEGPATVKLLGTGKLEDNLFPLDSVKVVTIPKLVKDAQARANIPEGSVARVLLKRNLPDAMDVQFRVFVTSQRRDATVDADANGKLLD